MAEADQLMREASQARKQPFDKSIDVENTNRLKQIIDQIHSWPTISLVGEEASYAAWLIAQHADHDSHFQEQCLESMLQVKNDVLASNLAYLTDRVAVNKGQRQIYGTQFYENEKRNLVPRPIKDPEGLDERRLRMGLEPFVIYEQKMKGEYKWPEGYENPKVGRFNKSP